MNVTRAKELVDALPDPLCNDELVRRWRTHLTQSIKADGGLEKLSAIEQLYLARVLANTHSRIKYLRGDTGVWICDGCRAAAPGVTWFLQNNCKVEW